MGRLEKARMMLEKVGLPGRDELVPSTKTFPDGAHYRMEISGVERPSTIEALIDESDKRNMPIHRLISVVMGATLLDDKELKDFAQMAADARMEVILTPGPRAIWDIGRQIATPEGALSGLRFRGAEGMAHYLADVLRAIDLGFKGFLCIDEGMMMTLNKLKELGEIPKDIVFKVSIFAGHASPAGAKLLESLGATTFNPTGDLDLPKLCSLRKAVDFPIDLHVMLFKSMGSFNRLYETPDMAKYCSPVYYKIEPGESVGGLYAPWVSPDLLAFFAREKVKYCEFIHNLIQDTYPELKMSGRGPSDLAIPQP